MRVSTGRLSSEDIEEAVFQRLKAGEADKAAVARAKNATVAGTATKGGKPAAKPKPVEGKVLPMPYKVEWSRKNMDHLRKRNTFMCPPLRSGQAEAREDVSESRCSGQETHDEPLTRGRWNGVGQAHGQA